MRIFLCFLVGISLTIGDKLDRTYLPPPGSKLSGGSDGDLLGPLDYSRPSKDQLESQPETEGPISNVSTQFGQRPSDQGFIAKEYVGQITSGTRRPYQGTQQGFIDGSVPSSGSDQGPQTDRNEPLSRLPIPGSRTNTKYQVTSLPQRATTPKYNPTSAPSRFDTQAPFDFEASEGFKPEDGTVYQQSNTRKNFPSINKKDFDVNTPAAPVEDIQEGDQADDTEKNRNRLNQNVSKPESTGRYPQENVKDYYQGSRTTIRPSTFAPKEQSYFYKSKPTVPSRKVTESQRTAEYSEEYPEDTVSGQGNFNRQGYPTTARPSTFAPKDQKSYSKSKTVTPSRVVEVTKSDRPTQYSEDYPQENVSDENNYYGQGTSTARPSTFAPKDQTYYSKQKTVAPSRVVTEPKSELPTQYSEQYPQGNVSDENNYYRQGTSTIQPNTFAPEEEKYYAEKESTPSQRPDISRVKSGRPTFGKPTYSTSSSRPVQPESDYYDQYSTTVPETDAQDDINAFEDNSKTIKPYSSDRPSIDEPKAAIKSEYTTASPYNDVTISDFEEGLIKANEKYGQNIPTDAQDIKPLVPTVPAFRNQGGLVPEFKRPERPQAESDRNAVIINYQNEITPEGNFAYSFDTSNGIHADESGTASDGVRAQGEYSYTGDDGRFYSVFYSADENGFQPRGDHLPTPPPIPEAILRVIEQAQRDKEAGISNDGSYDENKYGYKKYNGPVVGQPKLFDKTQEAFVTDKRRPINKLTQGKYRPIMGKYDDSEDNKDYLDVEKAEDEANPEETSNKDDGNQYTSQFTRRPINKTTKQNERPGVSQKQERVDSNAPVDRYFSSRKPTVEVSQDDEETVEDTNASDDQEVYPNLSQKETDSRPERIQSKYDSGRRGPTNVVKGQDVTFGEFVSSDDNKGERVTGIQKGIKVGPSKAPVKSNRFPEQKNRPYDDIPANDDSTQINLSNVEKEEINVTPESFINKKIRVQSTPTGSQSNQDRFVKYKPGSRIREDDFDSVRRIPAEKAQERYYDTNRDEQRYPTQKLNKPTNVKVDDFGREIQSEVSDITTLDDESNDRDFDSIKPSTFESQQKIAPQNRYTQRPTGTQGSGYDYIPPRNKFIQEPNRTLNKYTTDGKKTISPSAPADSSSAGEEEEIAEQPENASEDRTYNGVVNPVTGKPKTKSPRPASTSPIDSEYEYKKQYNKLFGQEPEKLASVTSTRKPFFAPESRVTYKPIERTGYDDQVSADEEKEFIGTDYDRNDKDEEILQRPTPSDQRLPSRTYSKTSRPEFNQNLRPNGEEKESFGGDYNRTDDEVQNIPTTSFERPTSDQRPTSGTFSKISRPVSYRVRPTDYNVPSTTYRPVFSVSVTENKFEESNYPTESSKVFDNENKRIPSNVNVNKTSKIRPVGSTTTPATDGSRFVTETKTVGEDFSGPQRPQYYDAQTGYHY